MTPTRDQLTAWVAQATAYATSQTSDLQEHGEILSERFATLAMSAGRDQGLREAKEACEALPESEWEQPDGRRASAEPTAQDCAAAIEQLRGK